MSSGSLPLGTYHGAQSVGSGTYGDVLTVYDDDGNGLALKLFKDDDSDDESTDSNDDHTRTNDHNNDNNVLKGMDLGAQREISILRLLRGINSHPNIIQIHDFKQRDELMEELDNGGGGGDERMSNMGIVMPLYTHGNLSDAINSNCIRNKKSKLKIAFGILSAVAFLHANGIIHRDIKGDNIMMDYDNDNDNDDSLVNYCPILIDFSLAKFIELQVYSTGSQLAAIQKIQKQQLDTSSDEKETTHTPCVGTPTYKAPEVVAQKPYGLPSDMYSVGVVLLELLNGKTLEAMKDKEGVKMTTEILDKLPNQPFANLIRGLLEVNPSKRLTASEALRSSVFKKFDIANETDLQRTTFKTIDIKTALPFDDDDDDDDDNDENNQSNSNKYNVNNRSIKKNKRLLKRVKIIRRIAHELESENPLTIHAAFTYSQQLSQLENCDDLTESQALCDCVVLAHQFFEKEVWSLQKIEELDRGIFREFEWSVESYVDTEETIFLLMDFCLYPRELLDII